jgi:hypothetical protein
MGANNSRIQEHTSETVFSFKVDDVKICKTDPSLKTAAEILKVNIGIEEKLEDFSHYGKKEAQFVTGPIPGFLLALHTAFESHYPLKLSVSDFIILLGQGLGRHIEKHAEELREYFVSHEGKEEIVIESGAFVKGQKNDWSAVFGGFGEEIKKRVKTDIYDIVIDDTSVATPTSRIVSEITLIDCMKSYFDYTVATRCGFPSISLEGTPEDWKKLREKYRKLVEMNKDDCMKLDFWLKHLTPIIEKICETGINRQADASFWTNIYKYQGPQGSGTPTVSGWCTVFFPYLAEDEINDFSSPASLSLSAIPKQMCKLPFIWRYCGVTIPMTFYGGFMGAQYDRTTKAISPAYFWCVAYNEKKDEKQ